MWKVIKKWFGTVVWLGLMLALGWSSLQEVIRAENPLAAAALFIPNLLVVVVATVAVAVAGVIYRRLEARLSPTRFRAVCIAAALTAALAISVLVRLASGDGGSAAGLEGSDQMILVVTGADYLRMAITDPSAWMDAATWPLAIYAFVGAIIAAIFTVERSLRGDALWAARLGIAALVAFAVVVVAPALHREAGSPLISSGLLTSLLLWLGITVPAIGVAIAYRRIGDGKTEVTPRL